MCRREIDMDQAAVDIAKGREVLPKNVRPVHYDLTLEPNLETFVYEGKVVIEYALSIHCAREIVLLTPDPLPLALMLSRTQPPSP